MKSKFNLVLMTLALAAAPAWGGNGPISITGVVTDSECGVNGVDARHKECFKTCMKNGAKLVIVTADKKVWVVENPGSLNGKETRTVTVRGTGDEQAHTIKVEKVEKE